jgi:hypothetical protein
MPTKKRETTKNNQARGEWPLGAFLRDARGQMSVRGAARRAGISEARWRQVEAGAQKVAGGIEVPVHPRAETVTAMARVVGADVTRALELAGFDPKHYDHLTSEAAADQLPDDLRWEWFEKLPRADRERVLAELQRLHVDAEVRQQRKVG